MTIDAHPLSPAASMTVHRSTAGALLAILLVVTGCASSGGGPVPEERPPSDAAAVDTARGAEEAPAEGERQAGERTGPRAALASVDPTGLPEIPHRGGPVELRVEYPDSLRLVRPDTNFIFGTVGTGDARLWIDGREVDVEPNGAFLAWLPVPGVEDEGDRTARYRLVVRRTSAGDSAAGDQAAEGERMEGGGTGDSVVLLHPVRRPRPGYEPPAAGAWIDSTSMDLPGLRWARPGETMRFAVRAAPGGEAWLELGDRRVSLEAGGSPDRYRTSIRADSVEEAVCPEDGLECLRWPEGSTVPFRLVAARGGDTVALFREMRLRVLEAGGLPVAQLREAPDPVHGQSGVVVGRPVPYGPYAWRFPDGTRAEVTGRWDERVRLSVPGGADAWVDMEDAAILPDGSRDPRVLVGDLAVTPRAELLRMEIPLSSTLPVTVSRPDDRSLVVRLHGARANIQRVNYGPSDPFLESVRWTQEPGPMVRLDFRLSEPLWGYRLRWKTDEGQDAGGGSGATLSVEIRSPPTIRREAPLQGRVVAVDPGHPGAGAYGPTGYYEGDANLAIARRLVEMLRQEGARPVLIRDDTLPVGLYERTNRAVEAGAELFVSIHNNALPDGVYPFGEEGTSTYYYHPHARGLAGAVQAGMLRHMGLRDLGLFWGNLAVARMSWMPSVLAEGAFMMMPRHEAALKMPEFQRAYARGVLEGIARFLAARAADAGARDSAGDPPRDSERQRRPEQDRREEER